MAIFEAEVAPILAEAGFAVTVLRTTHHRHAAELAAAFDLSAADALLIVSGDGLLSEARAVFFLLSALLFHSPAKVLADKMPADLFLPGRHGRS